MNSTGDKPLVLLVDDNPSNIQLLGGILYRNVDCDFAFSSSGEEALSTVEKTLPDLILLDVMMPGMDGFEVCRRLQADSRYVHIPIIFLTARVAEDDIVKGFEAGAIDYVAKPFSPQELIARVRTQLQIRASENVIRRQNEDYRQLLHMLCHDLNNPISSMSSILHLIDQNGDFMPLKDKLAGMADNTLRLIELVRQMCVVEEKGLLKGMAPVSLSFLIQSSQLMVNSRLTEKAVTLRIDVPDDLVVCVEQVSFTNSVLNNLLTNAIKFSPRGATIDVGAVREDQRILLSVRDSGIGMPEAILEHLFDITKVNSRPGTEGEGGTGFGMPLVKKFVEANNGTITVASVDIASGDPTHGTVVTIILPVYTVGSKNSSNP